MLVCQQPTIAMLEQHTEAASISAGLCEAVGGISEFYPERLVKKYSRDWCLFLVPNARVLEPDSEGYKVSSHLWFLHELWQISASTISPEAFGQVLWEEMPWESGVSLWVLLPLFSMRREHRSAAVLGPMPTSERERRGRGKAWREWREAWKRLKSRNMFGQKNASPWPCWGWDHVHPCGSSSEFQNSQLLFPNTMLLWKES